MRTQFLARCKAAENRAVFNPRPRSLQQRPRSPPAQIDAHQTADSADQKSRHHSTRLPQRPTLIPTKMQSFMVPRRARSGPGGPFVRDISPAQDSPCPRRPGALSSRCGKQGLPCDPRCRYAFASAVMPELCGRGVFREPTSHANPETTIPARAALPARAEKNRLLF
jgi:hypothetical protein